MSRMMVRAQYRLCIRILYFLYHVIKENEVSFFSKLRVQTTRINTPISNRGQLFYIPLNTAKYRTVPVCSLQSERIIVHYSYSFGILGEANRISGGDNGQERKAILWGFDESTRMCM